MSTGQERKSSHTPGPWRVDPTHSLCIESDNGNIGIVNLARASEADARLIAAAPDLLEALQKLLVWHEEVRHAVPATYLEQARAAVSQAEGRSRG